MDKTKLCKLIAGALLIVLSVALLGGLNGGDVKYVIKNRGDLGPIT